LVRVIGFVDTHLLWIFLDSIDKEDNDIKFCLFEEDKKIMEHYYRNVALCILEEGDRKIVENYYRNVV